ncbi:Uu.00g067440.m01.CDS01 [Anthostomella pinea]|uniref:Uu.00g067440.m01.CDS01 n=1 Tax=Anthostomella pinea TaxID=933095 RepID=A0AAI8YN94_9PEZI|nr:Uu.00g067440.m01.CDS01 [Anthostomella pinea]
MSGRGKSPKIGKIVPFSERGSCATIQEIWRVDRHHQRQELDRSIVRFDDVESRSIEHAIIAKYQPGIGGSCLAAFTVQSPYLLNFLSKVFKDYPDIDTAPNEFKFKEPFLLFFYRWDLFEQLMLEENDEKVLSHVRLLYDLVRKEVEPKKEKVRDFRLKGLIDFDHVFALFEPGTETGKTGYGLYPGGSTWDGIGANSGHFAFARQYVDGNGKELGYVTTSGHISKFSGTRRITELSCFPISELADNTLRAKLVERGRRFAQLNGYRYKSYFGYVIIPETGPRRIYSNYVARGRIIIDPKTYVRYNSSYTSEDFTSIISRNAPKEKPETRSDASGVHESRVEQKGEPDSGHGELLTEDQYALCSPYVRGYCLTNKSWAKFSVDDVSEIVWNDKAFESLVLSPEYKKVLLASVDAQLSKADVFDDVIHGKGKGIIMMLQGEPGTGKTLSAESIAEEMKQPLYIMRAGELGEVASEVDTKLESILDMCTTWGAVLLLDECDVFLEKRREASMSKTKLVAVFLRLLEYYQGVMFLTTNRIASIDQAFESRIHLTIHFPPLDITARLAIWQNFIKTSDNPASDPPSAAHQSKCQLEQGDLLRMAELDLNGRQIKNVV